MAHSYCKGNNSDTADCTCGSHSNNDICKNSFCEHQHHSEKDRYDNFYGIHSAKDHHNFGKPQETSKKSKKTTEPDEDPYDGDKDDNGDAVGDIQCISAVYLHPQPTSSSENLLTIPSGATCKYYRNENGWYYVEYNGTKGYAWQTFFSTPPQ